MRITVTGASGYIGSHVVTKLLDMGHQVVAVDIKDDYIDKRAELVNLDIFSSEHIYEKLGSPDIVLHLAWKDGFAHNAETHMQYIFNHYKFINDLLASGLKNIAVMGTMHEIGYFEGAVDEKTPTNPLSFYGIAKNSLRSAIELLSKKYNVNYYWIRAYYILGDDSRNNSVFSKIAQMEQEGQEVFPFVSGKNKYDFIDVNDLAYQISCAILQTDITGVINCCSGRPEPIAIKVDEYIKNNNYKIKPDYGKFPEREYDSPAIWGNNEKIMSIIDTYEKNNSLR